MRLTIRDLKAMKKRNEKIPMITAYDYTFAKIMDSVGIPVILVGDSLGNVVLGHDTTLPVTMENMIYHVKAVVRGARNAHIVADMPFLSYQVDESEAILNAGRMLQEGGAQSVKLEGGSHIAGTVRNIVKSGIPVMGHIGLTPQSFNQLSGNRLQGKSIQAVDRLLKDALVLEEAGVYAIVLEVVPTELAKLITERISVPTIGIGAGHYCDGQVQVMHDLLGCLSDFVPKHARRYASLAETISSAVTEYMKDVREKRFPSLSESHAMKPSVVKELTNQHYGVV